MEISGSCDEGGFPQYFRRCPLGELSFLIMLEVEPCYCCFCKIKFKRVEVPGMRQSVVPNGLQVYTTKVTKRQGRPKILRVAQPFSDPGLATNTAVRVT